MFVSAGGDGGMSAAYLPDGAGRPQEGGLALQHNSPGAGQLINTNNKYLKY